MRVSRRLILTGALAAATRPRPASAAAEYNLTVMGQALIQHDLRTDPWPDFAVLAARFGRADLCFTDLETAIISAQAEAPTRQGVFLHAADPVVLDCLGDLHVGLLATANNHAFDLGAGGIVGALGELDARGLTHAGSGGDLAAAAAPAYRRTANGTVGLVAAASGAIRTGGAAPRRAGVNELHGDAAAGLDPADVARVLGAIGEAAAKADLAIAYHHNHLLSENGHRTPQWQRDFAHRCIDAGAALYVSHGAPRLQGIELYRGRPIFYDLGSLIFQTATEDGTYDETVWQSVLAECRFAAGQFVEMVLTPIQLSAEGVGGPGDLATRGRPSLAYGAQAAAILDRLAALSEPFGTRIERSGETATVRG